MIRKLLILFLLIIITIVPFVNAATVHGNVYDLSLSIVKGAKIEINTTPQQIFVSKEGAYSLEIPKGTYTLRSELVQNNRLIAFEERGITVNEEGSYVIDFILFPSFEEEDLISEDPDLDIPDTDESDIGILIVIFAVFLIGSLFIYYLYKKHKSELKSNEKEKIAEKQSISEESQENYLEEVLKIIEEEDGRTTQKEIRKKIPLSEAKISLLIAELEHKGKIKKIKKGRGNIIILNNEK